LCDMLSDPKARAGYARAARAKVEADYSRVAMLRRFERFYRNLVG
jgi:hypothetical protein